MEISKYCTGCRACEQGCPTKAIDIIRDKEGFYVARINDSKCVNCDKCRRICPQLNDIEKTAAREVYALKLKDDTALMRSASGGAFAALARSVIEKGGYVFGSAYDENLRARHICVNDEDGLRKLQGSKYVQDDTAQTYSECESLLKDGKTVLYSGVPCQIAGLKAYLGKEYVNLVTVDIICHGVPSSLLFEHYIEELESRLGGKIEYYSFRDKEKYGHGYGIKAVTAQRTVNISPQLDKYFMAFMKGSVYNESCYRCRYAVAPRVSDITIGDFWGIEKFHPEFADKRGVSVIMANTQKGAALFDEIKDKVQYLKSDFEKAALRNENLNHPSARPALRDKTYKGIDEMSAAEFMAQFPYKPGLKEYIKAYTPKWIKDIIRGR